VVVSPLVALLAFGGEAPEVSVMPGMRRLGLLGKSVLLAGAVAAAAMVLGILVASVLWSWQEPPYRQLRWLVLAFAVIPAYIHALAWTTGAGAVTRFLAALGLPEVGLSGWFGCAVVQTMTYLPFAVGLGLLGLEAVDRKLVDAARTQRPAESVFGRVVLPLALPMLAGGAALIFVLSITDYSLPLLFQRNVYALEIFAEYSAGTTPLSTLIIAWPLLAATVLVLVTSQAGLRQLVLRRGDSRDRPPSAFEWPTWFVLLQAVACGLLLVHLVLPLVVLAGEVSSW
jgi:iron(III) transport system permease protein